MAFSFVAKGELTGTSTANPVTVSFDVGAGNLLVLFLLYAGITDRTGGAPTYGGQSMSDAAGTNWVTGGETTIELWYLLNPPSGTQTLSIPNANSRVIKAWLASFAAGAGMAPVFSGAFTELSPSSDNPTVIVTVPSAGALSTAVVGSGLDAWAPAGRSGVQLYDADLGTYGGGCQYQVHSAAGTPAVYWVADVDDFVITAAVFAEQSLGVVASASISAVMTVTPGARLSASGAVALVASAANGFTARVLRTGEAVSAASALVTAVARAQVRGECALASAGTVTAGALLTVRTAVAVAASAVMTAGAVVQSAASPQCAISAVSVLSASGLLTAERISLTNSRVPWSMNTVSSLLRN